MSWETNWRIADTWAWRQVTRTDFNLGYTAVPRGVRSTEYDERNAPHPYG